MVGETMTADSDAHRIAAFKAFSRATSLVVMVIGCLVLAGWALDNEVLKRIVPGLVAMNPTTALCFILAGLALFLSQPEATHSKMRRTVQSLASVIITVGLLKLITLISGWDFKVDQLLFTSQLNSDPIQPNRMAPNTAVNFVLVGWTLLLLDVQTQRGQIAPQGGVTPRATPSQLLILTIAPLALLPIIGYAYGMKSLQGVASFIPMALHTATTFLLLGLGLLFARPQRGLMIVVASNTTGGATVRRLLPAACSVPVLLGWLRLQGQRAGWYDLEFGSALLVVSHIFVFTLLLWWNASLLYRKDIERRQIEDALRESEERFRCSLNAMQEGLILCDGNEVILLCNQRAEQILGARETMLIGQKSLDVPSNAVREDGSAFPLDELPVRVALRTGHLIRDVVMGLPQPAEECLWISVNAVPLSHPGEEHPYAALATFQDITARKRAEQRLAEQQLALEEANVKLEALAVTDGLTGLKNYRALQERLQVEFDRASRYHSPLSLILLDVDKFKQYNDAFGHPAGDEVLRTVARLLQEKARATDFVARYGGEEFAVVLPDTDAAGASIAAERFRVAMEAAPWTERAITASLGISTKNSATIDIVTLIAEADKALYHSKEHGRNRVTHAPCEHSPVDDMGAG